jgi:hypothetical protein
MTPNGSSIGPGTIKKPIPNTSSTMNATRRRISMGFSFIFNGRSVFAC